jgi:hypothetical protein
MSNWRDKLLEKSSQEQTKKNEIRKMASNEVNDIWPKAGQNLKKSKIGKVDENRSMTRRPDDGGGKYL